ncbi:MAG: sugar ABC transporter permease [Calditrichaeota bacterium]|nr:MAG: sugar ABC transporter permease [Calditrichota bacterium]
MTSVASDSVASTAVPKRKLGPKERADRMWGLIFISPWILGILLWYLVPMLASLAFSFYDFDLVRPEDARFIGLGNYIKLLRDPLVYQSMWVTVKFALIATPSLLALPLAFAWLLTSKSLRGKSFFRTFFFVPTIVPFVSVVFIWNGFLNTQTGWLNRFLAAVGIPGPDWLNSTFWIYPALVLIGFWGVGNAMLLFIASIQGIPQELYEAADVDGANNWHKFIHISIPMITPIIFYNLILLLIAIFNYFLVPFVLKNGTGDPNNATLFYSLYFFKTAFTFNDMGYGATLAWVLFLIILVVTIILFGTAKYWVYYEFEEA